MTWLALASLLLPFTVSVSTKGQETGVSAVGTTHTETKDYADAKSKEVGPAQMDSQLSAAMPGDGARGNRPGKESKDLTAFFAIGFVINILAIGAFLFWAAGQWRKKK